MNIKLIHKHCHDNVTHSLHLSGFRKVPLNILHIKIHNALATCCK